jgi:twitching motility protein PilT
MEKLNEFLQTLLSTSSYELHLQPNKNPYIVSANGSSDVSNTPLLGTQISMIVFPLIPASIKQELPNKSEVEFTHPHVLGNFSFNVKKSPAGFNVTIRPMLTDSPLKDATAPIEATNSVPFPSAQSNIQSNVPFLGAQIESAPKVEKPVFSFESASSDLSKNNNLNVEATSLNELIVEEKVSAPNEFVPTATPGIEIVSVNDPQFVTTFSDSSTYEPPGKRDDFITSNDEYSAPSVDYSASQNNYSSYQEAISKTEDYQIEYPETQTFQETENYPQTQNFQPMQNYQTAQSYEMQQQPTQAAFVPAASNSSMKSRMDALFYKMSEFGASDLHLSVSVPPMVRKDGKMQKLECNETTLTADSMKELLNSIMPSKNQEEFAARNDTDFAYEIPGLARFRANIFADRKGMGGVFRIIPTKILTAEQLGLSQAIMNLCDLSKGLVVVTGPTGSGKSTTLCAMVDSINKNREDHIITIEDPIEFTHENQNCLVNQREVHNHTDSFKDALRAALREDPDILLVGEMRDLETISIAIETAETGHLVFGTLHTTTACSTVDRIIDQFPADRQQQIRVMLSESLRGVISQTLLPKIGGGRVAALEVLIITPAISNLIREGKTFQIPSAMQTGKQLGMVMLNDALFVLVQKGLVAPRDAYIKAVDKANFETLLTRNGFKI